MGRNRKRSRKTALASAAAGVHALEAPTTTLSSDADDDLSHGAGPAGAHNPTAEAGALPEESSSDEAGETQEPPAQNLTLSLNTANLDPEVVRALLAAGAVVSAPGQPLAAGVATAIQLPPTLPEGTRAFALRKLIFRNKLTGAERMYCCLPAMPREEWAHDPNVEEVINGVDADGVARGELMNYTEEVRDQILMNFRTNFDPLRVNDDPNAPKSKFN